MDHERAAHALEWQAGIEDAEDAVALAHEDVLVLEGKSMAGPDESARLAEDLGLARERLDAAYRRQWAADDAYENAGHQYDSDGELDMAFYRSIEGERGYLGLWVLNNGDVFAQIRAADRELAIRSGLAEHRETVAYKEIGTDGQVLLADRGCRPAVWTGGSGGPRRRS